MDRFQGFQTVSKIRKLSRPIVKNIIFLRTLTVIRTVINCIAKII